MVSKAIDLLKSARRSGINISVNEKGELQLKFAKGIHIEPQLLQNIKDNKELITSFLIDNKYNSKKVGAFENELQKFDRGTIENIPLSFSQERLWFIDQLEGTLQYHIPAVLRLKGNLNQDALINALKNIVNRHEVLRTVFQEKDGQAYQYIMDADKLQVSIIDGVKYQEDAKGLQKYIEELIRLPFDLSADHMLRSAIIQLDAEEHLLVVTMHHIASDGWSLAIIVKEVAELYSAFHENRPASLPVLAIQYADYAIWQRKNLQGEVINEKIRYWKSKLEGVTPLQVPIDFPRPAVQSTRGATVPCRIDKDLLVALNELSQQQGTTLFMTLFSAFNILLHRYSGQQDICIGTPIAGRQYPEVEGLIGFFINTLALRNEVNSNHSFTELLQQVRTTTMDAYEHQEVPFEKVVEVVIKERDSSRSPLFQVLFVLQNTPEVPELRLGELILSKDKMLHDTSKFDISFYLAETANGLEGGFEFCTDLFTAKTIERLTDHYKNLLTAILKNPNQKIGALSMLNNAEEKQLLSGFNQTLSAYPRNKSLVDLFEEQSASTPTAIAVDFEGQVLSYLELNQRANQLAHYLIKKGIKAETLVPICIDRGLGMIVGLLGILKAGAAYVPVDPEYPFDRISYMLQDSGASIVVSSTESKVKLKTLDKFDVIDIVEDWSVINEQSIQNPLIINSRPDHLAYVIYTSGSTGNPKGVMIQHGSVVNLLISIAHEVGFTADCSFLSVTTFSFDICYLEFYIPLLTGGKLIIVPREVAIDGFRLAKSISNYCPSHMQGTPSTWQLLLEADWKNIEAIKILIGGEALKESLKDQLTDIGDVYNLYGPTETTIWSAIKHLDRNVKVSIGKPLANTSIYILNDQLQLCPVNVAGEICIAGDGLARGYLNRPELTGEKFMKDPFNIEIGSLMYKTGDLGRWLPDGNIEYIRRIDEQVKIRGYRIELGEIETALLKSELVNQAVVLAKDDKQNNKKLIGYYIPKRQVIKERERLLYDRQVESWKEIYETEYANGKISADEEFDINIWNDSFTGMPIAEEQMQEWLKDIVDIILSTQPEKVLEIGCGSGLIYYQLAGKLKKYTGTDFSSSSIEHIKQRISKGLRDYGPTELQVCAAHEITLQEEEKVDTVILNSIVQYFPGEDYMTGVIGKSISILKNKGRIIIGDVRDNRLLELFKGRLHILKLQHSVSVQEFKWLIDQDVLKEEELCFSPEYFLKLKTLFPQITHIELKWKQSSFINELTLYRYTVVLYVGMEASVNKPDWKNWNDSAGKKQAIAMLQQQAAIVALKGVPNPRLGQEEALSKALKDKLVSTVGDLLNVLGKENKDHPEIKEILTLAQANGYQYQLLLNEDPLLVNILLELKPSNGFVQNAYNEVSADPNALHTNIPLFNDISILLQKELRIVLQQSLPEYMVPPEMIALSRLPLTNNGKVDRKFLNERDDTGVVNKLNYEPPRDPLEQKLASIWQEMLAVETVGIHDNFFEMGGHSLLGTRVVSLIRKQIEVEVAIKDLFLNPTIETLAGHLRKQNKGLLIPSIDVQLRPERIPLSFSQERLWFIDQLEGSVQYHMPAVMRMKGTLSREALVFALQTIVERHEVLRTVFMEEEHGRAYQHINDKTEWKLTEINVSEYKEDRQHILKKIDRIIKEPFDLSKDYLLRAHLLTLDENDHILIVTIHHIASDGWSRSVLVKEVGELYSSYQEGRAHQLPSLSLQYADFAIWQRRYLQGDVLAKKLEYWKNKLQDITPLQLPTDYSRPPVWSKRGAFARFSIDKGLLKRIQVLGQQKDATLFMTLMTAFKVMLYRYTGQEDICVGTPIAGRQQQELERLIGFFVNTLALRTQINDTISFTELLQQVRSTTLESYENQDVPFEKVVDAVVSERDMSRNPVFQVMLALLNTPEIQQLDLGELTLTGEGHDHTTAMFDMTFFITETPNGLQGLVEYCTDLFHPDTIERLMGHFKELLTSIVKDPQQQVGALKMIRKPEEDLLLFGFNDTYAKFPDNKTIIDLFEAQAAKTPNAVAVIFEEEQLSYQQLNERSNQFAHFLVTNRVTNETLVPICVERGADMIIGILGILKAGGAYVPIDPEYPEERIRYMLEDSKGILIVSSSQSKLKIPGSQALIIELDNDASIDRQPKHNPQTAIRTDQLAYVIYTSGSTGKPKGVMIEHKNAASFIYWCQQEFASSPFDIVYASTSICFDLSIYEIFYPLSIGKKIRVIENGLYIGKYLKKDRNVLTNTVPSVVQSLLKDGTDLRNISVMNMAGEPIPLAVQHSLNADQIEVRNLYGPTEDTTYSTVYRLQNGEKVLIGKPIANTQVYITNHRMELVPVGVAGEVCIAGAGLARGYLNRSELTAEKFISNPFSTDSESRLYKTGDLGRWLPDGNIEYLGRLDHQVKIRGYRIELGEIETVLQQCELVNEAVVLTRNENEGPKRLVSYIVPNWQAVKSKERELYLNQVASWKELYETEYEKTEEDEAVDREFNIIGWNDSFAGGPIAADQMKEWLQDIVQLILAGNPQHVLEIGCGTGLIYYQLAGKVKKYIGTDFSRSSINQIQERISKGLREYGETELQVCSAHEISLRETEQVDTIIINSVVQYFPGEDYLNDVIRNSISLLKGKGRIIIGDVRDNRLLQLFKSRLQLQKLQDSVSIKEFHWAVDQEVLKEEELCFSPEFFYNLKTLYPQITHVEIQWKQSSYINEMTLYRYNVIIYVGMEGSFMDPGWQNWKDISENQIIDQFKQNTLLIALMDVPNHRLAQERMLNQSLKNRSANNVSEVLQALRQEDIAGKEVQTLLDNAQEHGYHYRLLLDEDPLKMNILLEQHPTNNFIKQVYTKKEHTHDTLFTNIPLFTNIAAHFQKDIRSLLLQRLPEYMVPSEFITLGHLPLTSNGKVDRTFLNQRDDKSVANKINYEAPRTKLEQLLATIWQELMRLDTVGIYDNFFELGGHSLLGTRVIASIRKQLGVEVAIKDLFMFPTIANLANHIQGLTKGTILPAIELMPRPERIPLSFSQERLWFIHNLNGSMQYHMPAVLRLKGNVSIAGLEHALKSIVNRHEVLRTVFLEEKDGAYQNINGDDGWRLTIDDGSIYKDDEQGLKLYIQKIINKPFDLSNDYMLRAHLVTLATDDHLLIVTMHHIASDGWSISIIVKEVAEFYNSYEQKRAVQLETLPIQYADYAIWQRNYLIGEVLDKKLDYWKSKLDQVSSLQLPVDYPRPAVQSTRGATVYFSIEKEWVLGLNELGKQHGTTLFMTLLAAFKVLMHRYSGQEDICIGSPIAGRQQQEVEGLIGLFLNTLALRSEVRDNDLFTELLQQIKETTLDAYEHQELPFEKIVDAVVKGRDRSRSPIFQVMFVLQNTPEVSQLRLQNVQLTREGFIPNVSKFDVTLFVTETTNGLQGAMEYCTDLFSRHTIDRMIAHFKKLLSSIITKPNERIGLLSILSRHEENQLLLHFNDTVAEMPSDKTVIDVFEGQVRKTPQALAVAFKDVELTYDQLNQRSNQLAHYLRNKGVTEETLVPICIDRSPEMLIGILGILKAGGAYVPIDPEYPAERITFILEDINAGLILCNKEIISKISIPGSLEIIQLEDWQVVEGMPKENLPITFTSSHLAYIIYTSGSTGKPKGVMIEHFSLLNYLLNNKAKYIDDASKNSGSFIHLSYTFDASLTALFMPLLSGKSVVIGSKQSLEVFEDINLQKYSPYDFIKITPSHLILLESAMQLAGESLLTKRLVIGGEALHAGQFDAFYSKGIHVEIVNEYGPTEATVGCSTYRFQSVEDHQKIKNGISIGKPLDNVQLYIVNQSNSLLPVGVAGEICIGGAGLARGYLNRAELTEEKFIKNPFSKEPGARIYKTGDVGRWLPDGNIEYMGRIDDQVKIRGFRIELGEIESVLQQSEGVRQAVVLAKEDKEGNKRLVGYVVPEQSFSKETVLDYLKQNLPEYMIPALWVELTTLPLTRNGKVNKKMLPDPDGDSLVDANKYVAPRNDVEEKLSEIWKELLHLEKVGMYDNFFELGGHSLLAMRMRTGIESVLLVSIPIHALFQFTCINDLGKYIEIQSNNGKKEKDETVFKLLDI